MKEGRNVTDAGHVLPEQTHSSPTFAVLIIMAVVIFLENAAVCLLFAIKKKLQTTTNIFVVSLAISDLLVGALFVPVYLNTSVGNQANLYIVTFLLFSSLFNVCGVTYERYHAILQPLTYHSVFTCRRIMTILLLMWFLPVLAIVLPFTWDHHNLVFVVPLSRAYIGLLVFVVFFTCVVVCKVYYNVFKAIRRQMKMMRHVKGMFGPSPSVTSIEGDHPNSTSRSHTDWETRSLCPESPPIQRGLSTKPESHFNGANTGKNLARQVKKRRFKKHSEKLLNDVRAAKLFAFIVLIFIICWLPVVITNFMVAIDRVTLVPQFIFDISIYAFVANALVNPLLYTFYKSDYRRVLLDVTGYARKRRKSDISTELLELSSIGSK